VAAGDARSARRRPRRTEGAVRVKDGHDPVAVSEYHEAKQRRTDTTGVMLESATRPVKKGPDLPTTQPAIVTDLPAWAAWFLQFKSFAILFVAAAVVTAVATPIYILAARRLGWVDQPVGRKRHERATPTMGGLVIFAVVFAGALVAVRLDNFVGEMLRARSTYIYGLIACTAAMLGLGMVDDRHGVPPRVKLLIQTVVAVSAIYLGFRVQAVTLPWFESVPIPNIPSLALSLVWIVGITNAINLTDGLDGLAAGICLLAASVNAVVAIWLGNYYMTVMMVLLAGALLGFLRWNFYPARVFLGDTGSLALGMYLALASLQSAQKAQTVVLILVPLFALGYPIFDTLLAVARRVVRGQPLFSSDRDHIHHRLLDRGRSPSRTAIQIYIVSIVVSLICIAAMSANHLAVGLGVAGVLLLALFSVRVLGYLEWGGWTAHWTGREETKVLHAAAHLARLKIDRARSVDELVQALAVIAPEIGCHAIVFDGPAGTARWDTGRPAAGSERAHAFQMAMGDVGAIQWHVAGGDVLTDEHRQLVEELSQRAGARLARTAAGRGEP